MSQIPNQRKLKLEDFPGVPEEFSDVFDIINKAIEALVRALQGGITRSENLGQKRVRAKVPHNEEVTLTLEQVTGRVRLAAVFPISLSDPVRFGSSSLGQGKVTYRVMFESAPAELVECDLYFEQVAA